jgi:glucokinase
MQTHVIGIDIGGTHTKMGIVSRDGTIQGYRAMPTDASGTDPEPYLQRLFGLIDELLATSDQDTVGIGVSMHGELDDAMRGTVLGLNTPALIGLDMRGRLSECYQKPVRIYNDLMAHTLGEYYFGTGQGVPRFMCLAVGTGLGAGVIVDGKPLLIDGGNSGNTGLVVIDPDGEVGATGIRGCAEDLCGVAGIEQLARARYGREVSAREVIAAAHTGQDPEAAAIMQQIGHYLGHTLAILSVIFYPHRIALTGGTAAAGDVLLSACRERFEELVGGFFDHIATLPWSHYQKAEIILGKGGPNSGILGAAVELLGLLEK